MLWIYLLSTPPIHEFFLGSIFFREHFDGEHFFLGSILFWEAFFGEHLAGNIWIYTTYSHPSIIDVGDTFVVDSVDVDRVDVVGLAIGVIP